MVTYNYGTTASNADIGALIGGIIAAFLVFIIFIAIIAVVVMVAKYKLFQKMDEEGWKALIPVVSDYFLLEKVGLDAKWLLIVTYGSIVTIVPILGSLAFLAVMIYYSVLKCVSLANSFGKSTGFALGLLFLGPVFYCILAFGDSKYVGAKPMDDIIFKNAKSSKKSK